MERGKPVLYSRNRHGICPVVSTCECARWNGYLVAGSFFILFLFYINGCFATVYVCALYVCNAQGNRRGLQTSQDQSDCEPLVSAGNQTWVLTASAHDCSSTSPASTSIMVSSLLLPFLHLPSHLLVRNMGYRHREPLT